MFVCGGFSTCLSVCCGVVNVRAQAAAGCAGRHFANAPRFAPPRPPKPPKPPPRAAAGARRLRSRCRVAAEPRARASAKHACIAANSRRRRARDVRGRSRKVLPPVFSFATIFGTIPSCALRAASAPVVTWATPEIAAICFAAVCWNVSCVPGRKKSWTKCVPGLPSFERSVTTRGSPGSGRGSRRPPPPGPGSRRLVLLRRERHRQVGADPRERVKRLLLRPVETAREAEMTITSATPRPSPSSVTIVRARRRTSSLRR